MHYTIGVASRPRTLKATLEQVSRSHAVGVLGERVGAPFYQRDLAPRPRTPRACQCFWSSARCSPGSRGTFRQAADG